MSQCQSCDRKVCEGPPLCGLRYIARSPAREHGGFHPETVKIAKQSIRLILKLKKEVARP